jgi:hypothetical protein
MDISLTWPFKPFSPEASNYLQTLVNNSNSSNFAAKTNGHSTATVSTGVNEFLVDDSKLYGPECPILSDDPTTDDSSVDFQNPILPEPLPAPISEWPELPLPIAQPVPLLEPPKPTRKTIPARQFVEIIAECRATDDSWHTVAHRVGTSANSVYNRWKNICKALLWEDGTIRDKPLVSYDVDVLLVQKWYNILKQKRQKSWATAEYLEKFVALIRAPWKKVATKMGENKEKLRNRWKLLQKEFLDDDGNIKPKSAYSYPIDAKAVQKAWKRLYPK